MQQNVIIFILLFLTELSQKVFHTLVPSFMVVCWMVQKLKKKKVEVSQILLPAMTIIQLSLLLLYNFLSFFQKAVIQNLFEKPLACFSIVCIGYQPPPQKHHPLFLATPPPLNLTVQAPLFRQSLSILVFRELSLPYFESNEILN